MAATALLVTPSTTAAKAASAPHLKASPTASAASDGQRPGDGTDQQVARFERQLARADYASQQGSEEVFILNQKYCTGAVFSAMWPNPQSPYIISSLPEVPGQAPNTNTPRTWRIRQDEAVVLIGTTPPPVEYFSFDLTMLKGSLPVGPVLWTSVGDPVNLKTIHTRGRTPYSRQFALVITGNRRTRDEVNQMLAASGLGGATTDMTIPPAMFRLGLEAGTDEFLLGIRTSVPKAGFEQALEDYRATPPLQVFRVRPGSGAADQTQPVYQPDPLRVPPLRTSGNGENELNLNPTLQTLRQRIIDAHPGYDVHEEVVQRGFEESYPGLQNNLVIDPPTTGVGALSYDADDPITDNISLPDGSFAVAYGTNHVSTGQATYSSITLNADTKAAVAVEAKDNVALLGSARDFIPDQKNADKFYAWTFSRADNGPTGPHVTQLPSTTTDFCAQYNGTRSVDLSTVRFVARAYMQPDTLTRPALSALLLDRVLVFTPKK
ncbi:hypothetical protein [Catenulispora subtropica]|uniref:hypothetical protein n=1 Tax=Catenulispora subtropica TaxID=450798 RepID=UPI0031DF6414